MKGRGDFTRLEDMPIPLDAKVGPGWTDQMRELADHIGAYATLCICAEYGGQRVYISRNPAASPFYSSISHTVAATLARVYAGNRLFVPVGRAAVSRARRAGVIAAVRAGKLTGADAQRIIGTSRSYIAHLVHHTDEGLDTRSRSRAGAPSPQLDLFANAADVDGE